MEVRVPRSRVAEGNFVQYELCTQGADGGGEGVAWRRFNEFKKLNAALRSDSGLEADLPELPSSGSFFARYGITATDADERRAHLESYIQEVVGQVSEGSEILREFLALDTEQAEAAARPEKRETPPTPTPQRSESIEVPGANPRSGAQAFSGSPYAISPPDSYQGDEQAEVFDLASWVLLQDSDDEEEAASTRKGGNGGGPASEQHSIASSDVPSNDGGPKEASAKHEEHQAAVSVLTEPPAKPKRSYVAAARASLLVGEALPPEPTKLQMVSWLHRNTSTEFLRENHLTGHPRAIANARSREELADAYYLALVAKVPVDKLEGLIFDTMDSDLDERVNRNELRYSPFEQSLGPAWDQIANGKRHIERSDWSRYVEAAKTRVGGAVEKFLADLVFEADVDVAHLLPHPAGHVS
jgi:hypothetical protein